MVRIGVPIVDSDGGEVNSPLNNGREHLVERLRRRFTDVFACHKALRGLREMNIPFYVIVGNHGLRRNTDFVDGFALTGDAIRLTRSPTILDDEVTLYGINSVRESDWEDAGFSLEPADGELVRFVAMHQLFSPPIDPVDNEASNVIDLDPVFDRFETEVDAVAFGDCHERMSDTYRGVPVWYPGATERTGRDKPRPSVDLLTISWGQEPPIDRERLPLNTREFIEIDSEFSKSDTFDRVERRVAERRQVKDAVVFVDVSGAKNGVTKQEILDYSRRDVVHADVTDERVVEVIAGDLDDIDTESEIDVDTELDAAVDELDYLQLKDAETCLIELVTPFVFTPECPGANDHTTRDGGPRTVTISGSARRGSSNSVTF